jgi:hypothetical protein
MLLIVVNQRRLPFTNSSGKIICGPVLKKADAGLQKIETPAKGANVIDIFSINLYIAPTN